MKKILKIGGMLLLVAPVLTVAWLWYSAGQNNAAAAQEALAALASDATVNIDSGDWLVMRPTDGPAKTGIILYPGAYCDIRGYAPVLRQIAAAGYLVIAVGMPFDFAIFAPNRAELVREAYPEVTNWIIAGHSMGGAMAGVYAHDHQDDLAGVMLWDSYPTPGSSLAESDLPVLHIHRATPDGQPPQKHQDNRYLFPESSEWVPIPEGLHMYFGSFDGGVYEESWEAGITRERQHDMIVAVTLEWLQRVPSRM